MSDALQRPSLGSAVYYKDPFAALDWLEKAFGFKRQLVVTDTQRLERMSSTHALRVFTYSEETIHLFGVANEALLSRDNNGPSHGPRYHQVT